MQEEFQPGDYDPQDPSDGMPLVILCIRLINFPCTVRIALDPNQDYLMLLFRRRSWTSISFVSATKRFDASFVGRAGRPFILKMLLVMPMRTMVSPWLLSTMTHFVNSVYPIVFILTFILSFTPHLGVPPWRVSHLE